MANTHHPRAERPPRPSRRRRYRLRDPRRLAAVVSGFVLFAVLVAWAVWPNTGTAGSGPGTPGSPGQGAGAAGGVAGDTAGAVWVLLMGVDRRPGDSGRSDSMILAGLTADPPGLRMLSLPRDTQVNIPGHGTGKLNAAYAIGGPELALATVSDLLGIPVRYYVTVDMDGFRWAVDKLGGVEVEVDRRMYYKDPYQDLRIDLQPGKQRLNGEQALQFLRFRLSADGHHDDDLTRAQRQQRFLRAVLAQAITPDHWPELVDILKNAGQYVKTNLSLQDELALGQRLLAARDHIETAILPGTTAEVGGAWYYIADRSAAQQLLANWAQPGSPGEPASAPAPSPSALPATPQP